MTLRPERGPPLPALSAALGFRVFPVQERPIAGPEVLGFVASGAFLFLGHAHTRRIGQPVQELPVPAVDQGRAVGDAPGRRHGLGLDLVIGDDAADESFS